MLTLARALLALLALAAPLAAPVLAAPPPLIPREVLFGNPERARPTISPDGKRLAWIAPDDKNVLQVWVQTVGREDKKKVTADKKRGIRQYFWAKDDRTPEWSRGGAFLAPPHLFGRQSLSCERPGELADIPDRTRFDRADLHGHGDGPLSLVLVALGRRGRPPVGLPADVGQEDHQDARQDLDLSLPEVDAHITRGRNPACP